MMTEYIEVLEGIERKLSNLDLTESTHLIKRTFCEYFRRKYPGLPICVGDSRIPDSLKDHPEWLYDLTITEYDENYQYLRGIYLALECEWGGEEEIQEDFEKLLQSSAYRKIMIFLAEDLAEWEDFRTQLVTTFEEFKTNIIDERYLLACWVNKEDAFEFEEFTAAP